MSGRRANRTDGNHAEVRDRFRALGCRVEDWSRVGEGIPDLAVLFPNGSKAWVEVKDGSKPPSARKMTPAELEFQAWWGTIVIKSIEEVDELVRLRPRQCRSQEDCSTKAAKYHLCGVACVARGCCG